MNRRNAPRASAKKMTGKDFQKKMHFFAYATDKTDNRFGLQIAWSRDGFSWNLFGDGFAWLSSPFDAGDTGRKFINPFVFRAGDGVFHCVYQTGCKDSRFAHASSKDLVHWSRQNIFRTNRSAVRNPVVEQTLNGFAVLFRDAEGKAWRTETSDWKRFSDATPEADFVDPRTTLALPNGTWTGVELEAEQAVFDALREDVAFRELYEQRMHQESMSEDPIRFRDLRPFSATLRIDASKSKDIGDMLLGIFYEDINQAGDGGLYAELIQNRDFEQGWDDPTGKRPEWSRKHAWRLEGEGTAFDIETATPIHANNEHYAVLTTETPGAKLVNEGFGGIVLRKGELYDFSLFVRAVEGPGALKIRLAEQGRVLAETEVRQDKPEWIRTKLTLTASDDAERAELEILSLEPGKVALDMISLFPRKTYKERENGLRADLVRTLKALKPRFMRFPGGCVAHGDYLENTYHWKNTIGPLEARKQMPNRWGYHQSMGLGYYEYFLLCEDLECEPLPVMHCGVTCQFPFGQDAVPMDEMPEVVQEYLDLIEFANGPADSGWGAVRAQLGHPEPFRLKYVGVGNEEQITDAFEERFRMIFDALKEKHPEIVVVGTAGPFIRGTDYVEGWDIARRIGLPIIDEHYYVRPGWFIHHQDFYDKYPRDCGTKIYAGEYAAHRPDRRAVVETALAEAMHLINVERNGDLVKMTSYAPLFAKVGYAQWNPDLIYFTNSEVLPTPGYEVQKLFGCNSGSEYLANALQTPSGLDDAARIRVAASVVRDPKSGDMILKFANLLPVTVSVNVEGAADGDAVRTILSGSPDDEKAALVEEIPLPDPSECALPPYSFTVVRIRKGAESKR